MKQERYLNGGALRNSRTSRKPAVKCDDASQAQRVVADQLEQLARQGVQQMLMTALQEEGLEIIEKHPCDFVAKRIAPVYPENDGKQTPMANHPVFVTQPATATCCRKCLNKWHHIETGKELTVEQSDQIVSVIMSRIWHELDGTGP